MSRKPKGFAEFDALTRKLVKVSKKELDQQQAKRVPRKRRKAK